MTGPVLGGSGSGAVGAVGDGWTIDRQLGRDATGDVYAAHRVGRLEPMVVKVVRARLTDEVIDRLGRVEHPHLTTYLGIGRAGGDDADGGPDVRTGRADGDDLVWIATERARRSLARRIGEHDGTAATPLRRGEAKELWRQLMLALGHLQKQGIVHGDITPARILEFETRDGAEWRLTDFALAVELDPGRGDATMRRHTPGYASPRAVGRGKVGYADDGYAAAVTVHVAATGAPPADDGTTLKVSPRLPRALQRQIAGALDGAVGSRKVVSVVPWWRSAPVKVVAALNAAAALIAVVTFAVSALLGDGDRSTGDPSPEGSEVGSPSGPSSRDTGAGTTAGGDDPGTAGGGRLLVTRRIGDATGIVEIDVGTGAAEPLAFGDVEPTEASAGAGGTPIAFVDGGDRSRPLGFLPDRDAEPRLFDVGGRVSRPAVAPGGELIAYVTEAGGDRDIAILDLRTGRSRALVAERVDERDPAWSHDGSLLAVVREGSNADTIVTVDPVSGETTEIATEAGISSPTWSPDRAGIAFVAESRGGRDLYVVDLATGRVEMVAPTGDDELDVTWTVGNVLVSSATGRGLSAVAPDGGGLRQLTTDASDRYPTAVPAPP